MSRIRVWTSAGKWSKEVVGMDKVDLMERALLLGMPKTSVYDENGEEMDTYTVEKEGKCGYIDKYGNVVIPFDFYAAFQFCDGIARVITVDPEIVDKWDYSYIDKTGKIINPK